MVASPAGQQHCNALRGFLAGDVSLADLQSILASFLTIAVTPEAVRADYRRSLECSVELEPVSLRPMLSKYLRGEVDAPGLARWATVIRLIDAYRNPPAIDALPDEVGDAIRDPVWDLLSDLATPAVFGPITASSVRQALSRLEALQLEYDRVLGQRA